MSKYRLLLALALAAALTLPACQRRQKLVEVFDNGPVGGRQGPSEGYIWVGADDLPPPGKSWLPTDPNTLTPDQRQRIH